MERKYKIVDQDGKRWSKTKRKEFARENGLMENDLDQFAICQDGSIVLLDECGNFAYCPDLRAVEVSEYEKYLTPISEFWNKYYGYNIPKLAQEVHRCNYLESLKEYDPYIIKCVTDYFSEHPNADGVVINDKYLWNKSKIVSEFQKKLREFLSMKDKDVLKIGYYHPVDFAKGKISVQVTKYHWDEQQITVRICWMASGKEQMQEFQDYIKDYFLKVPNVSIKHSEPGKIAFSIKY